MTARERDVAGVGDGVAVGDDVADAVVGVRVDAVLSMVRPGSGWLDGDESLAEVIGGVSPRTVTCPWRWRCWSRAGVEVGLGDGVGRGAGDGRAGREASAWPGRSRRWPGRR